MSRPDLSIMSSQEPLFAVRPADVADIPHLAHHRVGMFRDMGKLAPALAEPLARATVSYLRDAMPRGEYLGWIAHDTVTPAAVIGGAGVQLRAIMPRPRPEGDELELGPEAIILNVYVEPEWRRRGVAEAMMRAVLDSLAARGIQRTVLHASDDGRRLYERLGFVPTNEMLLAPRANP